MQYIMVVCVLSAGMPGVLPCWAMQFCAYIQLGLVHLNQVQFCDDKFCSGLPSMKCEVLIQLCC